MRKVNCKWDAHIDSIRPPNFVLFTDKQPPSTSQQTTQPPSGIPPSFGANNSNEESNEKSNADRENKFNQVPLLKLGQAASLLGKHCQHLFGTVPARYLIQSKANKAHKAVQIAESKYRKEAAGVKTASAYAGLKPPLRR